ncbi:hypothetical protein LCGC14_0627740 [marine sediment metagenome]|uniref:Uncharacterized protein n=1 Tax=marine sediment metagenome TaxID=412755 RepID=A0A0F9R7Y7_9ZZZZ
MSRKDKGFIYLGSYIYARPLKRGGFSLYRGMYSSGGEDRTTGLEVMRDDNNQPLRFETSGKAQEYFVNRYC